MIRISHNHVLALLATALAAACVVSVCSPLRFDKLRAERERVVKERLINIRYAQARYLKAKGHYADDLSLLVESGLLADSAQYIPFANGRKFDLITTVHVGKSGRQTPLMECGASYGDYLSGLDEDAISELTEKANYAGTYPGLIIGDIKTPNNNAGNWE